MKSWLLRISPREWVLISCVGLLVVGFVFYRSWIIPAYDDWSAVRTEVQAKQLKYDELAGFLHVRDAVAKEYAALQPPAFQTKSDSITLSEFLSHLETLARLPGLTIVSAKPQPVKAYGIYRRYPIRLSISGTLENVSKFVTELLNGPNVTGLQSFSLRGEQGGTRVDCTLAIWMIRLSPLEQSHKQAVSPMPLAMKEGDR